MLIVSMIVLSQASGILCLSPCWLVALQFSFAFLQLGTAWLTLITNSVCRNLCLSVAFVKSDRTRPFLLPLAVSILLTELSDVAVARRLNQKVRSAMILNYICRFCHFYFYS